VDCRLEMGSASPSAMWRLVDGMVGTAVTMGRRMGMRRARTVEGYVPHDVSAVLDARPRRRAMGSAISSAWLRSVTMMMGTAVRMGTRMMVCGVHGVWREGCGECVVVPMIDPEVMIGCVGYFRFLDVGCDPT